MKGDESLLDSASLVYKVAMSGGGRGEIRRTEREEVDDDEEEDFDVRCRSTAGRKNRSSSESSSAEATAAQVRRSMNIKSIIDARGFGGARACRGACICLLINFLPFSILIL